MIPKIIHYCWLSNDPIPQDLQNYMQTWKEKLSGYEFMLWNFDRFDINSSLWVKQAFENKKYAFAADYIRLYAVYNYGGIYMDMDIDVLKSFDDLLDAPLMLAYENEAQSGIEAGCFGAEKHNPVIKEMLDWYADRPFVSMNGYTCPRVMISYTKKYPQLHIYTHDYFTCKSYRTGLIETTENSHTIHHFAGSWLTDFEKTNNALRFKYFNEHRSKRMAQLLYRLHICILRIKTFGFSSAIAHYAGKLTQKKEKD